MALSKNEAIKIAKDFLAFCVQKHDIKQAYLFGSFAQGTAGDYSDVDLAVILGTLRPSGDSIYDEDFEIFHEAQKHDSRLEVISFSEDIFDRGTESLIQRIKREGILVL